jgi:hypothetical protein
MQCPQDGIAAFFLLRQASRNSCDPGLNRSLPLFGELDWREATQRMKPLAVDNHASANREGRRRERPHCAIDIPRMNHGLGELAKQQAGHGEVDSLIYRCFAGTLKHSSESGDFTDEDDGPVTTELFNTLESLVYLFENGVTRLHLSAQSCNAQEADKRHRSISNRPVTVRGDGSPNRRKHKPKDVP